jgi:hypothetical protein
MAKYQAVETTAKIVAERPVEHPVELCGDAEAVCRRNIAATLPPTAGLIQSARRRGVASSRPFSARAVIPITALRGALAQIG